MFRRWRRGGRGVLNSDDNDVSLADTTGLQKTRHLVGSLLELYPRDRRVGAVGCRVDDGDLVAVLLG